MKRYLALAAADARSIRRDPTFVFLLTSPFVIGIMLRLLVPWADGFLTDRLDFSLAPHAPALAAFFLQLPPLLAGMMTGIVFLEERDAGLIDAYAVMPLGRDGFLSYRLAETGVLSVIFTLVTFLCIIPMVSEEAGVPFSPGAPLFLTAAAAVLLPSALAGPILTAFLAVFASDKVMGMALSKLSSFVILAPAVWYLVPGRPAELLNLIYTVPAFRAWLSLLGSGTGGGFAGLVPCTAAALGLEIVVLAVLVRVMRRSRKLPIPLIPRVLRPGG